MDGDAIGRLYDRVISGKTIVEDRGQLYVVRDPFAFDRQIAMMAYDKAYDDYSVGGTPTLEGVADILFESEIWDDSIKQIVEQLQEQKKSLRKELRGCEFKALTRASIEQKLIFINKQLKKYSRQKTYLSNISADYFARLEYYKALLYRLTFDVDDKRMWTTAEEFAQVDDRLLYKLLKEAYINDTIGETEIRLMARSEPWRSAWLGAVKSGNFLPRPISEATDLQKAAIQWSIIYDNAFESSDPPTSAVLANDDLFDLWIEDQSAKRKSDKGDDKFAGMTGEIGIVVETAEDAKKVYDMNGAASRQAVANRFKAVKEKGQISDAHLPDVKQRIQMEMNRNIMHAAKR